jgi:hypothetical protein
LRECALFEFDPLANDFLDPRLQVPLTVETCEECRALCETTGQSDSGSLSRNMHKRLPRGIIIRLRDDALVDFVLRQTTSTAVTYYSRRILAGGR